MVILVLERECERRGVRVSVEEEGEVVETFETTDETVERSTCGLLALLLNLWRV
jgi:fructose-specific phosphotransferase system component IIB